MPILRALPSGRSLLVGFAIVAAAIGLYALARFSRCSRCSGSRSRGRRRRLPRTFGPHWSRSRARACSRSRGGVAAGPGAPDGRLVGPVRPRLSAHAEDRRPARAARRDCAARSDAWLVSADARVIASAPLGTHRDLPRVWLSGAADPEHGAALATGGLSARCGRSRLPAAPGSRAASCSCAPRQGAGLRAGLRTGARLGDLHAIRLKLAVAAQTVPQVLQSGRILLPGRQPSPKRPVAGIEPSTRRLRLRLWRLDRH